MVAIDHFYVFCSEEAPERRALLEHGLQIGATRDHPGQGTRNVCFGFGDCYLELIWLADASVCNEPTQQRLALQQRMQWRDNDASPFGICLRSEPDRAAPFAHWQYRPPYLPEGMHIDVGINSSEAAEPMLFHLAREFTAMPEPHALSQHRLRQLTVQVPNLDVRSPWRELAVSGLDVIEGDTHRMEIQLHEGGETAARELDLGPELPVVLRW